MNILNITRKSLAVTFVVIGLALGVVVARPGQVSDLNFSHASNKHMTEAQKKTLVDSYNSGHPVPVGKNVCCCQPGWQVYDSSDFKCSGGKLINKHESR